MFQNCIQDDVHDIEGGDKKATGMYSAYKAALQVIEIHPRVNAPTRTDIPILFLSNHQNQVPDFQLNIYWAEQVVSKIFFCYIALNGEGKTYHRAGPGYTQRPSQLLPQSYTLVHATFIFST